MVMAAHPRSVSGGLCSILKFRFDRIESFVDNAIFIFWHFGLKLPIHAYFRGFGAHFPQMTSSIVLTPERHLLVRKHVVSVIRRENRSNGSTWARAREKTGQDSQKVTKALYFTK